MKKPDESLLTVDKRQSTVLYQKSSEISLLKTPFQTVPKKNNGNDISGSRTPANGGKVGNSPESSMKGGSRK